MGECAKFKFHPKYVALKLTYLCFADDLMVFWGAYLQFIQVTLEALNKSTKLSDLRANIVKGTFDTLNKN